LCDARGDLRLKIAQAMELDECPRTIAEVVRLSTVGDVSNFLSKFDRVPGVAHPTQSKSVRYVLHPSDRVG
jgi:hypothetical protein